MNEEEYKTKDDFNIQKTSPKEINILLETKRQTTNNDINISIQSNNNRDIILTYGNYKIFNYDKNGDPLFLIGPDYAYFSFLFFIKYYIFLFFIRYYYLSYKINFKYNRYYFKFNTNYNFYN